MSLEVCDQQNLESEPMGNRTRYFINACQKGSFAFYRNIFLHSGFPFLSFSYPPTDLPPISLSRRHNPSFPRVFVCGPAAERPRPRPGASAAHAHSTEWISTSHFLFLFWDSAPPESVNGWDLSCPLHRIHAKLQLIFLLLNITYIFLN